MEEWDLSCGDASLLAFRHDEACTCPRCEVITQRFGHRLYVPLENGRKRDVVLPPYE